MLPTLKRSVRRAIVRPWWLSKLWYRLHGLSLSGAPDDEVWYFAFGSNMHDGVFRKRRRMHPSEWRVGRIKNYRLCFNLEGRPWGKTTPANIEPCPGDEVWGVIYRITKRDLVRLDSTESMPGGGYRRLCLGAEDADKRPIKAFACITRGEETDGNPSLRYITLLREGARAHGLPRHWTSKLEHIRPADG